MEDKTGTGNIAKRSGRQKKGDERINVKRRGRQIKRKETMVGKEGERIREGKDDKEMEWIESKGKRRRR